MKKKILGTLLTTSMILSLTGCGSNTTEPIRVSEQVSEVSVEVQESVIETGEQTEENAESSKTEASGFEYNLTFDVDGTEKVIGFNRPGEYELTYSTEGAYNFQNPQDLYFSIAPYDLEAYQGIFVEAYDNYISKGEWTGPYLPERVLNERKVEVPGGTATIITAVQAEWYKNQTVFVEMDGSIILIQMAHTSNDDDFTTMEFVSGTEEEYYIDEVLAELFVATDNVEYVYPISESTVEIAEGSHEFFFNEIAPDRESKINYFEFNSPGEDFTVVGEEESSLGEEFEKYNTKDQYEFFDSKENKLSIISVNNTTDKDYGNLGVYRHFLRTGEMTEGVEGTYTGKGGYMDKYTGNLQDMQIGETMETQYGTVYIVKSLWQYENAAKVMEVAMLDVNGKQIFVNYTNNEVEAGTTLEGYESKLDDMLVEMFK